MSKDNDPQRTGHTSSGPTSAPPPAQPATPPPVQPANATPDFDPEKRNAMAKEIDSILRGIPFIGPYIVVVKLKWGWAGILLLLTGFMIATLLVFSGFFPASAVSDKYKASALSPHPLLSTEHRVYELKAQHDVPWEALVQKAKIRIWASGVSLSKLNPQLIAERVKEGVQVQLAYVDPCGKAIEQRMSDENNPGAARNIKANLSRFDTFTKDFDEAQKERLRVKLANVYPTMVVIIIDNDLLAYVCPYGATCTSSPVLVFRDYFEKKPKDTGAKFFEDHFLAVFSELKAIPDYKDPCASPSPR